ncbi:AAA family ATPase [Sphingobium sp. BYY-5]|uniref:bifunctional aminoglycoside phosphotransferase/ATP-binding protein n=1 Tax=Sphingobium sp. BYY-5 TaxID=2926400 RepID=UPI001FA74B82|nr:AAA family ATPase [Sphingobium sp. BYY-5]MCI4592476.1 AAA family ATPase [Sphingobium sp. BYY-5]
MAATSLDPLMTGESDVAAWLASGEAFEARSPVRRIDTHAASVFLTGDRAWKLKRPVRFNYLDFSTADRRRDILKAELRLNRRTAPTLYLAVHSVTRNARDQLAIDGDGEVVDWLLEMRRFPDDALWDDLARQGRLDDGALSKLTDRLVDFYRGAAITCTDGGAERLASVIAGNARSMAAFPDVLDTHRVDELTFDLRAQVARHACLLDARGQTGRIRHVHGDLHLANIATVDGVPTPFDCLEFDEQLATTDILYDIAFLLMDLWDRGLRHEANVVLNRYLDRSAADEDGIVLVPLFMAIRASIRAHVLAAQAAREPRDGQAAARAAEYLDLARVLTSGGPARLIAIGGLSGTGKSTLARALGGTVGTPPGARILRSDVLRKRMAGVEPETRLPASAYTALASRGVYGELVRLANKALTGGRAVIADAMFSQPAERDAITAAAEQAACRFDGIWLTISDESRVDRVRARPIDASDADASIAISQSTTHVPPPANWKILETAGETTEVVRRACGLLGLTGF